MSVAAAHAQNQHPAQQLLTEWLAVIISGDVAALGRVVAKDYREAALQRTPAERRTAIESDMMRSRPWTLHSFETRSETEGSLLIYSEMIETWMQVNAQVSAETP